MSSPDSTSNRVESFALTAVFAAASFGALIALPYQTRSGPASAGWWTQPALMPLVALTILCAANAISLFRDCMDFRAHPATAEERSQAGAAILGWFRPVEFFVYFIGYIFLLGRAGYFLSTALFVQFLMFRIGLRSLKWVAAGLGAALAMTMIFRWGLGIWVPTASLYDIFPAAARKFLTKWF